MSLLTKLIFLGVIAVAQVEDPSSRPPIYATAYKWGVADGCDEYCSVTAIGLSTGDHLLGKAAACPSEWLGLPYYEDGEISTWRTGVVYVAGERRYCVDTFGDEDNRRLTLVDGQAAYRVDFAEEDPYSFSLNTLFLDDWRVTWEEIPASWYN